RSCSARRTRSCSRAGTRCAGRPSVGKHAQPGRSRGGPTRGAMLRARRPSRLRASLRARESALAASQRKITGLPGGRPFYACAMGGAIAAGHRLTAEAGAEILAEGGNAVDACLAAAFVSWVAESPLTGPAAGGFLLVHRARDLSDRLLDFFVSVPGR